MEKSNSNATSSGPSVSSNVTSNGIGNNVQQPASQSKSGSEPLRNWLANNLHFISAFRAPGSKDKPESGPSGTGNAASTAVPQKSTWNKFYVTNFDINVVGPTSW